MKALWTEIGKQGGHPSSHNGTHQQNEPWFDLNAVQHINEYRSRTPPLMKMPCTPDKAYTVRDIFIKQIS